MMGENPFLSDPNINKVRKALCALEFLAVQDIFLTETAEFADVDPAGHVLPREGGDVHEHGPAGAARPQGDRPARPGPRGLADHLRASPTASGCPMDYGPPSEVFAEIAALMPDLRGPDVRATSAGRASSSRARTRSTRTARVLFTRRSPARARRSSSPPSGCRPTSCPDPEFPFVLNTGRVLQHWHTGSMTRRSNALDAIAPGAVRGHPPGRRRPRSASRDGRVRAGRAPARVDRDQARGLAPRDAGRVFIPFHFREAAANLLTIDALDPFGKIPEFKFCAVRIDAIADEPPAAPAPVPDAPQ